MTDLITEDLMVPSEPGIDIFVRNKRPTNLAKYTAERANDNVELIAPLTCGELPARWSTINVTRMCSLRVSVWASARNPAAAMQ
jgi:hypothetical protein